MFDVKTVLNAGCGGALHKSVSEPYFDRGYNMIGVDVSEGDLRQFVQMFNTDGLVANIMALPFEKDSFDLVNFTDILEHLHHPFLGLKEVARTLRPNGVVILSTNNRSAITKSCTNPLTFFERVVSLRYDSILPDRNILGMWTDSYFYHTEFSINEITALMDASNFEVVSLETQFPTKRLQKLTDIFQKSPVLRLMCSDFMIVGKKKAPLVNMDYSQSMQVPKS